MKLPSLGDVFYHPFTIHQLWLATHGMMSGGRGYGGVLLVSRFRVVHGALCLAWSQGNSGDSESWEKEIPSGERLHNYGKSPCSMGKSTMSMAIFNSKLLVYQRVNHPSGATKIATVWWRGVLNGTSLFGSRCWMHQQGMWKISIFWANSKLLFLGLWKTILLH